MVRLEYNSLVTKDIIDNYLSIIKDQTQRRDLLDTVSKFDIRIATKPVIRGDEFYYKIWIWRRGTKKRTQIKFYNRIELLKEKEISEKTILPSLRNILNRIRVYADVPEDFEEYCEISFRDPANEFNRNVYPRHLKRAKRFKKFITKEEIRSIPFLPFNDNEDENTKVEDFYDLEEEADLIPLSVIDLKDKREYDKLKELQNTVEYNAKIVESYGYDPYTGDYDTKKFHTTKDDKQLENITKDFRNYIKVLEEYNNYLKELIKKYNIKPTGNLVQRLAFSIDNYYNNDTNLQQQDFDFKFIMVAVRLEDFS